MSDARSAFIRNLKKEKAVLTASAKESHVSGGFMKDEDIIKLLKLNKTYKQYPAKLSRVRYGVDKNKDNYFSFDFVIIDGDHIGTPIGRYCSLAGDDRESKDKSAATLFRCFQALNVNTDQWELSGDELLEKLVDEADRLTQDKPEVILSMNVWGEKNDRLGVNIAALISSRPSSSSGTTAKPSKASPKASTGASRPTDEELTQWAEAADEKGSASCKKLEDVGKPLDDGENNLGDPDQFASWIDYVTRIIEVFPYEEEEEEEEEDAIDYASYVGYGCDYNADGEVISVTASAYDDSSELFTVVDDDGNEYETEWANLDFGNGYGTPTEE